MSSIKETKKRIASVKNTQKITKAMKLVSSSKYARISKSLTASQAYHAELFDNFSYLKAMVKPGWDPLRAKGHSDRPKEDKDQSISIIVLGSDKGLCGGLNANIYRLVKAFSDQQVGQVTYDLWGKRAIQYSDRLKNSQELKDLNLGQVLSSIKDATHYSFCAATAARFAEDYENEKLDRLYIAYPKFINILQQDVVIEELLPFTNAHPFEGKKQKPKDALDKSRIKVEGVIPSLLKETAVDYLASVIYQCVLHQQVSEHAARMTAMDNATSNAETVIRALTLEYNRARQAAITKELIEITSGAEAL